MIGSSCNCFAGALLQIQRLLTPGFNDINNHPIHYNWLLRKELISGKLLSSICGILSNAATLLGDRFAK